MNICFAQKSNFNEISKFLKIYNSKIEKLDNSVLARLSMLSKKDNLDLPTQLIFRLRNRDLTFRNRGKYYHYDKNENTL